MGGFARGCKHQKEQNLYIPTHVYDFGSRNSTLRHSTFSSSSRQCVAWVSSSWQCVAWVHTSRNWAFAKVLFLPHYNIKYLTLGRKVFRGGAGDCAASARGDMRLDVLYPPPPSCLQDAGGAGDASLEGAGDTRRNQDAPHCTYFTPFIDTLLT